MDTAKVSVREFRNRFGEYSESDKAVAVTKHGRTVGFYIPLRRRPEAEDLARLQKAGAALDAWMAEHGLSEEALVEDFKRWRKEKGRPRRE